MAQHLLFDCDGVLIDTEIVAAEVVSSWLQSIGVAIDLETYILKYTGKTFTDIIKSLQAEGEISQSLEVTAIVPELDIKIRDNQRPIDGVWQMLNSLNIPRSVVSNSAKDYVELALEKLSITEHFQGRIFSADMVEKGKPSPDVYLLALKTLGLKSEEVIVIEDSRAGVEAASEAGLEVIGFLGGSHVREGLEDNLRQAGAKHFAKDHKELAQLLAQV
ncbi:HAD family hydrolase [Roseivirga sp.]|uniref:HAD family hydrolase n=1 Tax=Roseivirga sp. TaxID=1964215 RepID=UPI003B8B7F09